MHPDPDNDDNNILAAHRWKGGRRRLDAYWVIFHIFFFIVVNFRSSVTGIRRIPTPEHILLLHMPRNYMIIFGIIINGQIAHGVAVVTGALSSIIKNTLNFIEAAKSKRWKRFFRARAQWRLCTGCWLIINWPIRGKIYNLLIIFAKCIFIQPSSISGYARDSVLFAQSEAILVAA